MRLLAPSSTLGTVPRWRSRITLLILLVPAAPLAAAQVTVDRFDDPPLSPMAVCTESLGDCSLRQAIELANLPGDMTILLPPGIYQLTVAGPDEDANQTDDLDYFDSSDLEIAATSGEPTVIQQTGSDRILDLLAGAGPVVVSGLTFTGGDVAASNGGGAIRTRAEHLGLSSVVLRDNQATSMGGCILVYKETGVETSFLGEDLVFDRCGSGFFGGALGVLQLPGSTGTVVVARSRFLDNGANVAGGALAARSGPGAITVEDCTFERNFVYPLAGENAAGGAIYGAGLDLTVRRSSFVDHRAGQPAANSVIGGTVYLEWQEYVAIFPEEPPPPTPSTARLENVTIARSSTAGFAQRGAGLAVDNGHLELVHTTITGSRTVGQAAIFVGAPEGPASLDSLASAIDGGCETFGSPTLASMGSNVEVPWDGGSSSTCGLGAQDLVAGDLRLGPPAIYGGAHGVATQRPQTGSPVLALVPSTDCLAVDARGAMRSAPTCDAGAHELAAMAPGPWVFADGFESSTTEAWSASLP